MDLKNAGIYVRVSTERQVQEGYSISAQKENLTNFAKGHDFKVYDIYADEGISGKNIEGRPDVKRLIKDIKDGKIDGELIMDKYKKENIKEREKLVYDFLVEKGW